MAVLKLESSNTFCESYKFFNTHCHAKNLSPYTILDYDRIQAHLVNFMGCDFGLSDFTENKLNEYIAFCKAIGNNEITINTKGIRILAPCTYKIYDNTSKDYVNRIAGFRIANVFDISQTEGDDSEIPEIVKGLTDDGQLNEIIFEQLINACPTDVSLNSTMSAKGSFNCETKQILIKNKCSLNQQAKTLFHEWAHFLCDNMKIRDDYATEECIAESVSFVVSERLGMNTSNYSIPYIASWQKDIDVMHSITETVQKLSRDILTRLDSLGVINLNGLKNQDSDNFREEDKYHD